MVKEKNLKKVLLVVGMVMAMFLLQPLPYASSALTIDNFVNAQPPASILTQSCTNPASADISNAALAPAAIGGNRLLQGNLTNDPAGSFPPNCVNGSQMSLFVNGGGTGTYNFGLLPTAEGNGLIVWSGGATAGLYLLNANFSANGDHITLSVITVDQDVTLNLDLYTSGSLASRATIPLLQGFSGDKTIALSTTSAGTYDSYFATQIGGAGPVNFSNVNEVHLSWVGPEALDLTIDFLDVQGDATVSCVGKTLNGLSAATIAPVIPPATTDLNVAVTVRNNPSSTANTPIQILDTLAASVVGSAWSYLGPTGVTCSNPVAPCPTVAGPVIVGNTLEWTTGAGTLAPGQTMTLTYQLRVTDLAAGNSKSNCVSVKMQPGDVYPSCTTSCIATVTATSPPSKVPTMNEWGLILTSILLCLGGVYLMRRKRGSAV